ncbi:MAG: hypothetical protein AAF629_24655, partial [Chloroflexota bacterium]
MQDSIRKLERFFLICFGLLVLMLIYWQVIRADVLLARDDNPRTIIAEQRIQRGAIKDANGIILAETIIDEQGLAARAYPYPAFGAILGYYSLRYGTDGLERVYDTRLRGDGTQSLLEQWMHQPQQGQAIHTTLQSQAQLAAVSAFAEVDANGAMIVINAETGAILVMTSHPTFDPNTLDSQWDDLIADPNAPLFNRATQGLFPVGDMARLIGLISQQEINRTLSPLDLQKPIPDLFASFRLEDLQNIINRLQLNQEVNFILPSATVDLPEDIRTKAQEITITPLHLAMIGCAISQEGLVPGPFISTQDVPIQAEKQSFMAGGTAKSIF